MRVVFGQDDLELRGRVGDVPPVAGDKGGVVRVSATAIRFEWISIRGDSVHKDHSQGFRCQAIDEKSGYVRSLPELKTKQINRIARRTICSPRVINHRGETEVR